jgi:hypothetical protein
MQELQEGNSNMKLSFSVAAIALLAVSACSGETAPGTPTPAPVAEAPMPEPAPVAQKDIVDTAVAAGSFNTLVAAVQAAGSRTDAARRWPVHRFRADRRGLRRSPGWHGRRPAEAGKQGQAHRHPDLPRAAG